MSDDLFPLLTEELARKVEAAIREFVASDDMTGEAFALIARRHGIGIVDTERLRCLVDENVYAGALHRGRRWERIALGYISPLLPGRLIWQELSKRRR